MGRKTQGLSTIVVQQYQNHRTAELSPHEAWRKTKAHFISQYTTGDSEQAWKNASGKALEQIVMQEFTRQIDGRNLANQIRVQQWDSIQDDLVKRILSETLWLRGELQEPYLAASQVDFVATEQDSGKPIRVIAVYSCKASLRERFQQDLYWAEKFRGRGLRFCFITLDNDGVLLRAVTKGELRSKQAKMAAALYDRIYLLTDEFINHYARVFRPIDALAEDLERWWEAG